MSTPWPTSGPSLGRGWFSLAQALTLALVLTLLAYAANTGFSFWAWRMFSGWQSDPSQIDHHHAVFYDSTTALMAVVLGVLRLAILALFIVWLFRAHRSDRMDPARVEHGSGWAIGGWFVPILNLWRPYQMVEDVRRASGPVGVIPSNLALWWWLSLLAGSVTDRITRLIVASQSEGDDPVGTLADANLSDAISSAFFFIAAVLAVMVVRGTTQLVRASPHAPRQQSDGSPAIQPG